MSTFRQACLSLYWFGVQAHWTAILLFLLPLQAEQAGGPDQKGQTLGQIIMVGAFVSMVCCPLFGAWSDRVRTRWGRRKPFVALGTVLNVGFLIALAYSPSRVDILILATIGVQLTNNLATAPYSALIPDVVPRAQSGSASGWMGLMMMLGNFVGGLTGIILKHVGIHGAYLIVAGILFLSMLGTVLTVHEPEHEPTEPFHFKDFFRDLLSPFRSRDFTWVFWTRFLVALGTYTVQIFFQYFLKDVMGAPFILFGHTVAETAEAATSFFVLALLGGALLSSLAAGYLSDRFGRKIMVYISGAVQGTFVLLMIFISDFQTAVLLGVVFGLGYGAYQAVDWALARDVLPSHEDHAKDMGVWHIALTLPQVLAAPIGGFVLDNGQAWGATHGHPHIGYTALFLMALVYFVLGTVLVKQVRAAR